MAKLYRNKEGKKLYPVCSWEKNQHKLYNANDRVWCAIYDAREAGEDTDKLYDALEKVQQAMGAFESHVINGLVYATWEDRNLIMDYIFAYNARH